MTTFVSVGNATQPFSRLLDAVADLAETLPQPVFVQYGANAGFSCARVEAAAFIPMEQFIQRVAQAEVLVLHAGAGSVINAVRAGKVPVVVPRKAALGEHVDDHQLEFARELAALGKVVVCEDMQDLAARISEAKAKQAAAAVRSDTPPLVAMVASLLESHARALAGGQADGVSAGD